MVKARPLPKSDLRRYAIYVIALALCVAIIVYLLMHAHPNSEPQILNPPATKSALTPASGALIESMGLTG